jgi:hypothetical protein
MNPIFSIDLVPAIIVIVKISVMIFTAIHLFFLLFILKQVHTMKELLSTFNQLLIEGMGITQIMIMILFLIYIIFLPQ